MELKSSSDRSTAASSQHIQLAYSLPRDSLWKLASIREGVTDLGRGQMPRLRSHERRTAAPWTLCFSAIFLTTSFSRRAWPSYRRGASKPGAGCRSSGARRRARAGGTGSRARPGWRRLDSDVLQELFGLSDVEVGDTDRLDEAGVDQLLHLAPGGVTSSHRGMSSLVLPFSALTTCECWGTSPAGVSTCHASWSRQPLTRAWERAWQPGPLPNRVLTSQCIK